MDATEGYQGGYLWPPSPSLNTPPPCRDRTLSPPPRYHRNIFEGRGRVEIGLTSVHIGFSPPGTGRLLPPLLLLSLSSSAGGLPTERERERERETAIAARNMAADTGSKGCEIYRRCCFESIYSISGRKWVDFIFWGDIRYKGWRFFFFEYRGIVLGFLEIVVRV